MRRRRLFIPTKEEKEEEEQERKDRHVVIKEGIKKRMVVRKLFEIDEEKGWGRVASIRCIKGVPLPFIAFHSATRARSYTPSSSRSTGPLPLAIRKWRCNLRRVNSTEICGQA